MHPTKKKIISKAQLLIRQNGYDGTSLNDVVKRAGVSKGAFFHYYPNKQAITVDILDAYAYGQLFAGMERAFSRPSVKEGLQAWLESVFRMYADTQFKGGCLLGNFALELSDKDEKIRDHMKKLFLEWENKLVAVLKPAQEEGKLLLEPRQFARLLIAALEGTIMTVKVHKDRNRAAREFQALTQGVQTLITD